MSRKRTALASVRYLNGAYKLYVAELHIATEGMPMNTYYSPSKVWTWEFLSKAARRINKTAKDKYTKTEVMLTTPNKKYIAPDFEIVGRQG